MVIFQTRCGKVGRCPIKGFCKGVEWLVPDCLNVFHWRDVHDMRTVDWSIVEEVQLSEQGYTEISPDVYMKTNEMQLHRKQHDPSTTEIASEHARFSRATSTNEFVQDIHSVVRNWPKSIPPNSMGRRLWETINNISERAALDEDNKSFLSVSHV